VLSGFAITGSGLNYSAVRIEGGGAGIHSASADASIALEDGSLHATGGVCIINQGTDMSLKTVYFSGATAVTAPVRTIPGLPGRGTWGVIDRWSYTGAGSVLTIKGVAVASKGEPTSFPEHTTLSLEAAGPPSWLVAMHSWSWTEEQPGWGAGDAVVDIVRDFGATPAWVNSTDDDAPRIQAALDQACPAGRTVFVPHGTFHVHSTIFLHAGCALVGAGKHVATISTFQAVFPADPATPIISVRGSGDDDQEEEEEEEEEEEAFVSDLVVQEEIAGIEAKLDPATVPLRTLLEVKAGLLLRDVRTHRLYVPSVGDVAAVVAAPQQAGAAVYQPASSVTVVGAAGAGRFYGLSLDHVAVSGAVGGALFTANGTKRPVHVYQLSSEHLCTPQAMVVMFRSANVALHAFKFESVASHAYDPNKKWEGQSAGSGGLMAAHSSYNISVFGGSGNFGIENATLGSDIFRSWGGDGLEIAALVRKPPPNESTAGKWVRTVQGSTVVVAADEPVALLRFSTSGV